MGEPTCDHWPLRPLECYSCAGRSLEADAREAQIAHYVAYPNLLAFAPEPIRRAALSRLRASPNPTPQ